MSLAFLLDWGFRRKKDGWMTSRHTGIVVQSRKANIGSLIGVIQRDLLPYIDREVHLYGRSKAYERKDSSKFRIFLWTSPLATRRTRKVPPSIWGVEVDHKGQALYPARSGVHFMDGEYCVASLHNRSDLHIHHNICYRGSDNERALLSLVLQEVVKYFQTDEWSKSDKAIFTKALTTSKRSALVTATQHNKLAAELRKLNALKESWSNLASSDVKKMLEAEIRKICSIKGVTGVRLESSRIHIDTSMLYCPHSRTGNVHAIGRFRITIDLTEVSANAVTWTNKSGGRYCPEGTPFPHSSGSGYACLGNARRTLISLLGKFEIAAATVYAIRFIQSANVSDPYGRRLGLWPVYRTREQIQKRKTPLPLVGSVKKKVECNIISEAGDHLLEITYLRRAENFRRQIKKHQTSILKLQKQITRGLRRDSQTTEEKAAVELERIKGLKEVKQVHCYSAGISVITDTLFCTSRTGSVHKIGKFCIWISFDGEVVWMNKSDDYEMDKPAPFIEEDGRVYITNVVVMFTALIGNNEIFSAVAQAIRFIQSDIGDGSEVARWPVIRNKGG